MGIKTRSEETTAGPQILWVQECVGSFRRHGSMRERTLLRLRQLIMRTLNNRETAILLAALRMAQEDIDTLNEMPHMSDEPNDVTLEEIDTLCEDLNFGTWELKN